MGPQAFIWPGAPPHAGPKIFPVIQSRFPFHWSCGGVVGHSRLGSMLFSWRIKDERSEDADPLRGMGLYGTMENLLLLLAEE